MNCTTIVKRLQRLIERARITTGTYITLKQNYIGQKKFDPEKLRGTTIIVIFDLNEEGPEPYGHVATYLYRSQQLWFVDAGGEAPTYYDENLPPARQLFHKDIQKHRQICAPLTVLFCHLFICGVEISEIGRRFESVNLKCVHCVARKYMDTYNLKVNLPKRDIRYYEPERATELFEFVEQQLGPAPTKGPAPSGKTPDAERKRRSRAQ